jgi:hypothetical protein
MSDGLRRELPKDEVDRIRKRMAEIRKRLYQHAVMDAKEITDLARELMDLEEKLKGVA